MAKIIVLVANPDQEDMDDDGEGDVCDDDIDGDGFDNDVEEKLSKGSVKDIETETVLLVVKPR